MEEIQDEKRMMSTGRIVMLKHRIFSKVNCFKMVSHYSLDHIDEQACRTSLTGEAYIQELLNIDHPQ